MRCTLNKMSEPILLTLCFSGILCVSMANLEGEETFEASMLGTCDEIIQERICDDELIFIKG